MTLLQLRYFKMLAHTLHYTRAAEDLHISQPSLSYAINELEKELGVKLFLKERKQVSLTAYGEQFLPFVEKSLSLLQEGKDLLQQMVSDAPQIVRLGYFHSVSASFIPDLVEGFYRQEENKNIRFQFTESPSYEVPRAIQSGVLDLGFSVHQVDWAECVEVARQPLLLAVPANHRLAKQSEASFKDFSGEPIIMLEKGSNLCANMERLFARYMTIPNVVFNVRECNAALQYVGMGFGVAVLPRVPAMDTDKVAVLPISDRDKEFVRSIYLIYHKTNPMTPATRTVCDYILKNYVLGK